MRDDLAADTKTDAAVAAVDSAKTNVDALATPFKTNHADFDREVLKLKNGPADLWDKFMNFLELWAHTKHVRAEYANCLAQYNSAVAQYNAAAGALKDMDPSSPEYNLRSSVNY